MALSDDYEQQLFDQALQAALDVDEIRTGIELTNITEHDLRSRLIAAQDAIWQQVRVERRQFRDLTNQVATLEGRLAERRIRKDSDDIALKEFGAHQERLQDLIQAFRADPTNWEQSSNLQYVRQTLLQLLSMLNGSLSRDELSITYGDSMLRHEVTNRLNDAVDAVDVALTAVNEQEAPSEPPTDRTNMVEKRRSRVRISADRIQSALEMLTVLRREFGARPTRLAAAGAADTELQQLRDQLRATSDALKQALIERGMLPVLRSIINEQQNDDLRRQVKIPELSARVPTPRLAGLASADPSQMVITPSAQRLSNILNQLPAATIGIAGPRGSGKTTLIEHFCADSDGPGLRLMVTAPVEYIPREFVLHLFAELCRKALVAAECSSDEILDPSAAGGRPWRFAPQLASLLNLLLGLAGFALVLISLATGGLQSEATRVAAGAVLILASAVLASGLLTGGSRKSSAKPYIERVPHLEWLLAPLDRLPRGVLPRVGVVGLLTIGAGIIVLPRHGVTPDVELVQAFALFGAGILSLLSASDVANRLVQWLIERRASSRVWPIRDHYKMAAWHLAIDALQSLGLMLIVTGIGWLVLWRLNIRPDVIFITGLGLLILSWVMAPLLRRWRTKVSSQLVDGEPLVIPIDPAPGDIANLAPQAAQLFRQIKFQQTWTYGWAGTLKVPGAVKLPVGLDAQLSGGSALARLQMTYPEVVSAFRSFVEKLEPYGGAVIGIDELDKMESDQTAWKFLNDVKAIFGLRRCYYLVSISEDALASFERRGIPFRDVFDSSFDDVIKADYFDLAAAKDLLSKGVTLLPEPFADLCYCLSGGLARDLIRTVHSMFEAREGKDVPLAELCRRLVLREQEAKTAAVVEAIKGIELEPDVSSLLYWLQGIVPTSGNDEPTQSDSARPLWTMVGTELLDYLSGQRRRLDEDWGAYTGGGQDSAYSQADSSVVTARQSLHRFSNELIGFFYYCATVTQFFEFADTSVLEQARSPASGYGTLEHLARSRQAFTLNAPLAWQQITRFRAAWNLTPLISPESLLAVGRYPNTRDA
jgi:hypothetical protein